MLANVATVAKNSNVACYNINVEKGITTVFQVTLNNIHHY